ncbi:hypothetical protein CHARACLAT_004679 [Characodon lateralis]|uniref:Uncharacterized protein n=1 Tax=Characodon lateralis TaxID=208331 RepID=A0ABU7DDR1_9TELE|nr:hypothetical protein [Characodon lateralis]
MAGLRLTAEERREEVLTCCTSTCTPFRSARSPSPLRDTRGRARHLCGLGGREGIVVQNYKNVGHWYYRPLNSEMLSWATHYTVLKKKKKNRFRGALFLPRRKKGRCSIAPSRVSLCMSLALDLYKKLYYKSAGINWKQILCRNFSNPEPRHPASDQRRCQAPTKRNQLDACSSNQENSPTATKRANQPAQCNTRNKNTPRKRGRTNNKPKTPLDPRCRTSRAPSNVLNTMLILTRCT